MKEAITKFDLEAAFKALDEIDVPVVKGVNANKPALTEIFSRKSKFDTLMEEYYDIGNMSELDDAREAREAEVAKAKLARIEKIVDLEAESPEDLLTSYVGKYIMQCPQCMTLFYKNPEDIEESEEDSETVNVNEVCQHCGNESGYTLIGKVGEVTQEEASEYQEEEPINIEADEMDVPEEEVAADEAAEDSENSDEDFDLDAELDLEIEEDEETEKAEESFNVSSGEQVLVEQLTEDTDLDVSADEFESLINSSEFKKPISDSEVRAMMDDDNSAEETEIEEAYKSLDNADQADDVLCYGKFLRARWTGGVPKVQRIGKEVYRVMHNKGGASVTVEFNSNGSTYYDFTVDGEHFTTDKVEAARDFVLNKLNAKRDSQFDLDLDESAKCDQKENCVNNESKEPAEVLEEGIFDKLKDKLVKVTDHLKSREAKAAWVLNNAVIDYDKAVLDADGNIETKKENQKFTAFIIIGYTDTLKNGNKVDSVSSYSGKDLVAGMKYPEVKNNYADAEKIAKGWSMKDNNGPAIIYLAKDPSGKGAAFLCQYVKGELDTKSDKLDKYIESIRRNLTGSKLMVKGGADQSDVKKLPAASIKQGTTIRIADGSIAEVTKIERSRLSDKMLKLEIKYENGDQETINMASDTTLDVLRTSAKTEGLDAIMNGLEDLHEASLEKLIADTLVEAYSNVAGFRLTECAYMNKKFIVNGTIYYTSGNKRRTTYTFTEARKSRNGKICVSGLNEKLGLDKHFTIIGHKDANRTFITESFKCTKK